MFYFNNILKMWDEKCRIAFTIGKFEVSWYGIFVMIGFILAITFSIIKLVCWYKVKGDPFYYFCLIGIPVAILGARFWSCCLGDADWHRFFNLRDGGLAIEGGVAFTILIALIWFPLILKRPSYFVRDELSTKLQVRQVSMWVYFDAVLPCIFLGQILGRWGNYFNQEVYGMSVNSQWLINMLEKYLPYMYVNNGTISSWMHPLFLYEGTLNLIGFILIYVCLEFIPKVKCGTIGASYLLYYGTIRLVLEKFRYSTYTFIGSYVLSALLVSISFILILLNQINVIPKTRKYRCKYYMSNMFKCKFNLFINSIKLFNAKNKVKKAQNNNLSSQEINDKISNYDYYEKKNQELITLKNTIKTNSIKDNSTMFFYLYR